MNKSNYRNIWNQHYQELVEFKHEFGHCFVSALCFDNPRLTNWVEMQRHLKRRGLLSQEKVKKLEDLDFDNNLELAKTQRQLFLKNWRLKKKQAHPESMGNWMRSFRTLRQFINKHGHSYVTENSINHSFFKWVQAQRSWGRRKLSPVKVALLDAIGFTWLEKRALWEYYFLQLKKYMNAHGTCEIKPTSVKRAHLRTWVTSQRRKRRRGHLRRERINQLDSVGFSWRPYSSWESKLERHLHSDWRSESRSKSWIQRQRWAWTKGLLTRDQIQKLKEAGIEYWQPQTRLTWDEYFGRLVEYRKKYPSCDTSWSRIKNTSLREWTTKQRMQKRRGQLCEEQIQKLNSIGFCWNTRDSIWNSMYERLVQFHDQNGHCLVSNKDDLQLAGWVVDQRCLNNQRTLRVDRKQKLDAIGFIWKVRGCRVPWETRFKQVARRMKGRKSFVCRNLADYDDKLFQWLKTQRRCWSAGILSRERYVRLKRIGFVFELRNRKWAQKASELAQFFEKHGSLDKRMLFREKPLLANWLRQQIYRNQIRLLPRWKLVYLEEIGVQFPSSSQATNQSK